MSHSGRVLTAGVENHRQVVLGLGELRVLAQNRAKPNLRLAILAREVQIDGASKLFKS